MTFTIGSWLFPLAGTAFAFSFALWVCRPDRGGYIRNISDAFVFRMGMREAVMASIIMWLAWGLMR